MMIYQPLPTYARPKPTLYPRWRSLAPKVNPVVMIEAPKPRNVETFECEITLAYRRNYLETNELYMVHGNNRIVELRPAMGELRRNPTKFVAIVLINNNHKAFKTVAIDAGQLLKVVQ